MKRKDHDEHLTKLARLLLDEVGEQGFALFLFDRSRFTAAPVEHLSNDRRRSLIVALKEFIAREEANYHQAPHRKQ